MPPTAQPPRDEFAGQTFSASLSLMAILVAVVAILVPLYSNALLTNRDLVRPFWYLVWGATIGVVLAGSTAGLSLARLRGKNVRPGLIVLLFSGLIAITTGGVIIFVAVTVKS